MEKKAHYKMYKAGKNWIFAMLTTVTLTGVMAMSGNTAKADTVTQSTTEQVAKIDTTSATTTSTQATTQVEKATNATNESNTAQTSATTITEQSSSNTSATSSSQNNKQATTATVATDANKDQASSTQSSTTQKSEESKVETPINTADNASQKNVNDNWYLVDNNTGKNLTGFQEIKDQNKVVYYAPNNAQMQYGWQNINSNKYYFDKFSGAMTTGQRNIDGSWYLFDDQGVMQTGFQRIENQSKTVYYNKNGQMQYSQQAIGNHWYLFDKYSGAMQTGFKNLAPYGQNKVVYYDEKGRMQHGLTKVNQKVYYLDNISGEVRKGQQAIGNHWYLFDKNSGVMQIGFKNLALYGQNKVVYYDEKGRMQHGLTKVNQKVYYLDNISGEVRKGQQSIGNHWYLFDKNSGAMQIGFKNLAPYGQNKVVYYDEKGRMQHGNQVINGKKYYFDKSSGKMYTGVAYNADTRTIQYYATNGQMQVGKLNIAGKTYVFDDKTGNLLMQGLVTLGGKNYLLDSNYRAITGQQIIGNHWYLFSKYDGSMQTGFQNLASYGQNKTVYYASNGQIQYGQQAINNHWYLFDRYSGAMQTGLQDLVPYGQNKIVYYAVNGQMQHGVFRIGKITYTADHMSGAIIGVYNDAEVIGQNPELPTGCEITAVTMMLRYAGANVNKIQLANEMPRSNNGDYGFVGNPFSVTGWWVFPTGVAPVVNKHLGHSQVMTGASLESIKNKLLNGHLVVAWVANMNGFVNHAIALTGYNGNILYYNNPWTARKESMSISSFYTHWNTDKQRALSY